MMQSFNIKGIFFQMVGRLFIPEELLKTRGQKILHLSDTPTTLYPAIKDFINALQPEIIIHTGDLADDIKLEHNPHHLQRYTHAAKSLLKILEKSSAQELYVVPGNHDNVDVLSNFAQRTKLVEEGATLSIGNATFGLAHTHKKLPNLTDFKLYGHNFSKPIDISEENHYLNGLLNIHVVTLPSCKVVKIPYPWFTNRDRRQEVLCLPKTI